MGSGAAGIKTGARMGSWRVQGEDLKYYNIVLVPFSIFVNHLYVFFLSSSFFFLHSFIFIGKSDLYREEER